MAELAITNTRDKKNGVLNFQTKNEALIEFNREVQERKQLTYGSRHRKCGSKSKKCTLPSDYLTAKERKSMDGEMQLYRMNDMIPIDEFVSYPEDIQQEYIQSIQKKHEASKEMIANMFAIPAPVFAEYTKDLMFDLIPATRVRAIARSFRRACVNDHPDVYRAQAKKLEAELTPICWYTFQELPVTHRKLYLDGVINHLNISFSQIASMFGVAVDTVYHHMDRYGYKLTRATTKSGGGTSKDKIKTFSDWLAGDVVVPGFNSMPSMPAPTTEAPKPKLAKAKTEKTVPVVTTAQNVFINNINVSGTLVFSGSAEDAVAKVQEFINKYMIAGQDVTVTLEF